MVLARGEDRVGSAWAARPGTVLGVSRAGSTDTFEDMTDLLPSRLSPSRASDFLQCPKLFYYKTLLHLSTPATEATTKGTLAHYAFEKVFDHPRDERVAKVAIPYVRVHWDEIKDKPDYVDIVAKGPGAVEAMLVDAERLVSNWFSIENPHRFDPEGREVYLKAQAAGVELHGYIDRLDKVETSTGEVRWYVSDYKTGAPPQDRYLDKAFFAMNVYALLANKVLGITPFELRLVYVKNGSAGDIRRQRVSENSLAAIERKLDAIWRAVRESARRGEFRTQTGPLCQWCHFQNECPAWATELVGTPMLDREGVPRPR
jgi:putative RecB family exonuclease